MINSMNINVDFTIALGNFCRSWNILSNTANDYYNFAGYSYSKNELFDTWIKLKATLKKLQALKQNVYFYGRKSGGLEKKLTFELLNSMKDESSKFNGMKEYAHSMWNNSRNNGYLQPYKHASNYIAPQTNNQENYIRQDRNGGLVIGKEFGDTINGQMAEIAVNTYNGISALADLFDDFITLIS